MTDAELFLSIGSVIFFIICSGFFAGAETALTAVSRARLYHLVMEGNRRAHIVSKVRRDKEALIGTILLGNTVVHISASAIATGVAVQLWGDNGVWIVTAILTFMVVVFGEVLPKTYAIQNAERFSLAVAPLTMFLIKALMPFTIGIRIFIRIIMRCFGVDMSKTNTLISAGDALRGTIELHHQEGEMIKQDRDMLGSILDLNDITVADIMVHRKQIEMMDADATGEELIRHAVNSTHSRIPLWKGKPENIVGLLHVKNLIREMTVRGGTLSSEAIVRIAAEPWFIPDTTTLREQLLAFRERKQHFAIVVDEYGALMGIVTLEDIIEEIVGDIRDEHDRKILPGIRRISDTIVVVDGTVTIRDLNRELDWSLPDEDASTIAGLVLHESRVIPELASVYEFYHCRFTIEEKKVNQLTRIRIEKLHTDSNVL